MVLILSSCGQPADDRSGTGGASSWQEQYDLGIRYLSEGNYEEAIIAFTAAIEIDPKQAPAYVGRGDAYLALGDGEKALLDYQSAADLGDSQASEKVETLRRDEPTQTLTPQDGYQKTERHDLSDGEYYMNEYNTYGLRERSTHYNADGQAVEITEYEYDEDGRLIAEYCNSLIADENTAYYNEYHYDKNERAVSRLLKWPDGKITEFTLIYTPESPVVEIRLIETGEYSGSTSLTYTMESPDNYVPASFGWTGGNDPCILELLECSPDGSLVQHVHYNRDGTIRGN